jgi:hypothetical protein
MYTRMLKRCNGCLKWILLYSSDGASTVSHLPLLGRGVSGRGIGRGVLELLGSAFDQQSSDSGSLVRKDIPKEQLEDGSPKKQSSSGRGSGSGRGRGSSGIASDELNIQPAIFGSRAESSNPAIEEEPAALPQVKTLSPEKPQGSVSTSVVHEEVNVEEEDYNDAPTVLKHGKCGEKFNSLTNCIMVKCDKNFGVFDYEVRFQPEVDNVRLRGKYLSQLKDVLGNVRTFDGVTLYLPIKLEDNVTELTTAAVDDGGEINVKIIFRRQARLGECVHLYNVLFERLMGILNYQRVGRKSFDPTSPKIIQQHKLEGNFFLDTLSYFLNSSQRYSH